MVYEIYIDVIFLVNLIMNFVIINLVSGLLKIPCKIIRQIVSSTIGSILMCMIYVFPIKNIFLQIFYSYVLISCVMIFIAFRPKKVISFIKILFTFFGITFLTGGIFNFLYQSTDVRIFLKYILNNKKLSGLSIKAFLFFAITTYCIVRFYLWVAEKRNKVRVCTHEVELSFNEKVINGKGFMDTGK